MKKVKSGKTDLEKNRGIFFQVGMVVTLAAVLAAFEWRSADPGTRSLDLNRFMIVDEDLAEITVQKKKEPAMPKPMLIKKIVVELNSANLEDEPLEINAEIDDGTFNDPDFAIIDEPERESVDPQPFRIVEEMPSFPGGEAAMFKFLNEHTKYPKMAIEANIKGTVHVEFVVATTGVITDVRLIRGIGGGCDEEALRVIRNMPRWNPGKQRGMAVPVRMTIPVQFKLLQ